jgi:hypothetical protein
LRKYDSDKLIGLIQERCPRVSHILETEYVGDSVDNGCGHDFDLRQFVIFVDGERDRLNEIWDLDRYIWNNDHILTPWLAFYDVTNKSELMAEMEEMDGYKVIWER